MSKEIYISSTPHETRLAIVESDELTEIYYERENEYTLAGSIYNGKVTRVLPGMQSSFVDIGLERDAFLYITDFMEEAADTAEFDHSGDSPRPPRLEGQRSESRNEQSNGNRDYGRNGNDRSNSYVSERNQEQASATPASDAARASEGRGEESGGRNDRSGRGRGRGRRDRGGNSDRPSSDRNQGERTPRFAQSPDIEDEKQNVFVPEPQLLNEAAPGVRPEGASPDLGEGAPGADGSRRWRGRRGRRRGRSTGQPEGLPGSEAQEGASASSPDFEVEPEGVPSFEMYGNAPLEAPPVAHTVTPLQPQQPIQSPAQERQRDRGGRNDRGDRNQRPPRAPRGFAPRSSLYGVEGAAEVEETPYGQPLESLAASAAEEEPLILPGESLSKYRKGEEAAPATASTSSFATPAALSDSGFKVDPNWDGGAMLPGETLSRYRGGSSQPSASQSRPNDRSDLRRSEGRGDGRNSRQNDRSRDGRRNNRDASPESSQRFSEQERDALARRQLHESDATATPMLVPSSVPAPDLQSPGPVSGYAQVNSQSEQIEAHQPDFLHSELPQATAEAPTMEDAGLAQQQGAHHHGSIEQIDAAQPPAVHEVKPEQEYEPEGQSVSYRVDPSAPSEYRQSAPAVIEEEAPAPAEPASHIAEETKEPPAALGEPHSEIVEPGTLQSVSAAHGDFPSEDESAVHPLNEPNPSTGFSGEVEPAFVHSAPHAAEEKAIAPHDVTTIHSTGEMDSHFDSTPDHVAEEQVSQGFAPGAGNLEEDFIEEEEFETANLQARGDEEFDELEEEHLDGAADLGMMIRDMSVDQITRSDGGSIEQEDDFEEDTLEDDADETEESEEEVEGHDNFASPLDSSEENRGHEDRSQRMSTEGVESPASTRSNDERRGRHDSSRRGGRDRSGNRSGRPDRSSSNETNGYGDRQSSSDRGYSSDRGGLGERARNTGGASDRDRGRSSGRGGGRQSMQSTNLPLISELLKPGQEILCQIAKEPIAKKGARITSHIALPGRFLVFMPTVSHTGVSRKIESDQERRRLKEILLSEKGEAAGGFIVRTAAAGATEEELRSDLRFLLNLWADIKQRSESSKSPALIYHDLNLVERILRDQVTDNFSAIWVDTETEYERVLRFLQRFQPGLIRRVKLYTKETPLFEQFGITEEINKALRSKVWLKSGGSIVINQTEALVAIDINTGKYVGKTARLEDTIVKTNLDAIPEIVRQIRLRDLGGIIIIDFIDMDERKNRNRVMQALEDELKNDRAPSKILPFNDFGLVAITRKRVKQSLERTLSTTCNVCTGTGMVKSPVTVCNDIYVEMRKMHKHLDRGDVMLRVNPEVVKQLKSTGTRWLQEMEEMCGKTILIKSDPSLHPEQFDIH